MVLGRRKSCQENARRSGDWEDVIGYDGEISLRVDQDVIFLGRFASEGELEGKCAE